MGEHDAAENNGGSDGTSEHRSRTFPLVPQAHRQHASEGGCPENRLDGEGERDARKRTRSRNTRHRRVRQEKCHRKQNWQDQPIYAEARRVRDRIGEKRKQNDAGKRTQRIEQPPCEAVKQRERASPNN